MIDTKKLFYSKDSLMGHNATWNLVLSARGHGKTYAFKKWCFEDDGQFIWLRRKVDEANDLCLHNGINFTGDLIKTGDLDPNTDIKMSSSAMSVDGEIKGFFYSLSKSQELKGKNFTYVNKIIFDETLLKEDGRCNRYLKNELELLYDLYETVNRMREAVGEPAVRLFMLANKTSPINPYFAEFGITPFEGEFKKFYSPGGRYVLVQNYNNDYFTELKKNTFIGGITEGKKINEMLVNNQFWDSELSFIKPKSKKAKLVYNLRFGTEYFGVWLDDEVYHISKQYNPQQKPYAMLHELKAGEEIMKKKYQPISGILFFMDYGRVTFSDVNVKNRILNLLNEVK